jgi:hypothetical protein
MFDLRKNNWHIRIITIQKHCCKSSGFINGIYMGNGLGFPVANNDPINQIVTAIHNVAGKTANTIFLTTFGKITKYFEVDERSITTKKEGRIPAKLFQDCERLSISVNALPEHVNTTTNIIKKRNTHKA